MVSSKFFRILAVIVAFACLAPMHAGAAVVGPGVSVSVTQSYAYTSWGGGDFVFGTTNPVAGCESGWYLKATDPGYKAAVSSVLTAQATGKLVTVYGDNADLWNGSVGHYCRLQTVGVTS